MRIPSATGTHLLRCWVLALSMVASFLVALASDTARHVTVAQLEQTLATLHSRQDAEIAQELSNLELTERLSPAALARLKPRLPGPASSLQLNLLANQAAFLPLPAEEVPVTPAPDPTVQRKIIALAIDYVTQAMHQMPNFLAERVTRGFVDRPEGLFARQPLHLVAQSSSTITYRDGHEIASPIAEKASTGRKKSAPPKENELAGLVSSGEFGPILSNVLMDAAKSRLAWGHWEQGPHDAIAVFRYQVPSKHSHYDLRFTLGTDSHSGIHWLPGYHGEISIDPASGAILRLTTVADLTPTDPLVTASILVEYGPVDIGGMRYTCPIRSLALAQQPQVGSMWGHSPSVIFTYLNETEFRNYHVFRGESRILTAEEAKLAGAPETEPDQPPTAPSPEPAARANAVAAESRPADTSIASQPTPPPPVTAITPDEKPDSPPPPIFKSTSREVILDVVVTRKDGDPVTGLLRPDFAVTENGQPQTLDFFEEHGPGNRPPQPALEMPPLPPGSVSNFRPAPSSDAVNVLLLDTLNTERADQAHVRWQIDDFLHKLQPGTQVAIFVLSSRLRFVQGFTTDTAQLIAALHDKKRGVEPVRDVMAHDRGDNVDDAAQIEHLTAMQAAGVQALEAAQQDVRAYSLGARAAITFEALDHIAHYLEGVPGRKNLIWFAGSIPLYFFPTPDQGASLEKNAHLPGYIEQVRKTSGLFTLSKIAVYPVGTQGVMSEHIMASAPGAANVGHDGSKPDAVLAPYTAGAAERANTISAMEQIAAMTGGKAYFNSNSLNDAMARAINDGAHYYTIGYHPANTKMDGTYRRIAVKVPETDLRVAHRGGYYADKGVGLPAGHDTDPLSELLTYGLPNSTGILYGVCALPQPVPPAGDAPSMGENTALKGPVRRYDVDFTIRAQDIDLAESPGPDHKADRKARILIGVKAYDRDGVPANWLGALEDMAVAPSELSQLQESGIHAHLQIDLPANTDLDLVTAIYDWNTGHNGTLAIPIHH